LLLQARDAAAVADFLGLAELADTFDAVALAHIHDLPTLGNTCPDVANGLVGLLAFDKMVKQVDTPDFLGKPMELNEVDILGVFLEIGDCCCLCRPL
jgi:hypothetical protein